MCTCVHTRTDTDTHTHTFQYKLLYSQNSVSSAPSKVPSQTELTQAKDKLYTNLRVGNLFFRNPIKLFKMATNMHVTPLERMKMINISRSYMKLVCRISVRLIVKILKYFHTSQ